jgi:hypothetical protein
MTATPEPTGSERHKCGQMSAAHSLVCIGELMEALGAGDEIEASLVEWLGEQIGHATEVVNHYLMLHEPSANAADPPALKGHLRPPAAVIPFLPLVTWILAAPVRWGGFFVRPPAAGYLSL